MTSRMTIKLQRSPSISSVRLIGHPDRCVACTVNDPIDGCPITACNMQADALRQKTIALANRNRYGSEENPLPKLHVHGFTICLHGYDAGPHQDLNNPLGIPGGALHQCVLPRRTLHKMLPQGGR